MVVRDVVKSTIGSNQTGFESCKQVIVLSRPRSSKHMRYLRPVRKFEQCVDAVGKSANLGKGSRKVSRTVCGTSSRWILSAPLMLERYRGTETCQVRKPKAPEGSSDVIVRESLDELTLRAEEVSTSKALMNVDHIKPGRWGSSLVDADWYAFCQALYKGIEGEEWEEMYDS